MTTKEQYLAEFARMSLPAQEEQLQLLVMALAMLARRKYAEESAGALLICLPVAAQSTPGAGAMPATVDAI